MGGGGRSLRQQAAGTLRSEMQPWACTFHRFGKCDDQGSGHSPGQRVHRERGATVVGCMSASVIWESIRVASTSSASKGSSFASRMRV